MERHVVVGGQEGLGGARGVNLGRIYDERRVSTKISTKVEEALYELARRQGKQRGELAVFCLFGAP